MQIRNYTKYTGAEQWLQETYPHLYPIWADAVSNTEQQQLINMELACNICRIKPSSGLHYGVKMCEADKQFLKRTFHYQIIYTPCAQGGNGVCPPRPRGWCQICRLRRCLSTPVMIGMIRVGNKSLKSRSSNSSPAPHNEPLFTIKVEQNQAVETQTLPLLASHRASPQSYEELLGAKEHNFIHYETAPVQHSVSSVYKREVTPSFSYNEEFVYSSRLKSELQYGDYISRVNDATIPYNSYPTTSIQPTSLHQSMNGSIFQNSINSVSDAVEDQPLDLSLKTGLGMRKWKEAEWYEQEPLEASAEFPSGIVYVDYEEPLDLSPLSNHTDPYEATDYSLSRDPSRPSSTDSGYYPNLRTPSPTLESSRLDGSQGISRLSVSINKLSVNSALLGDALSRIQANISMTSSLVNLSSVSDILSESKVAS